MFTSYAHPRWMRSRHCLSTSPSTRCKHYRMVLSFVFFVFTMVCITKVITLLLSVSTVISSHDIQTVLRTWGLDPSTYYRTTYPTAFTRDIHPRPIHSHNDYWRQVPLYSALAVGAVSVEADVYEYDEELFVGHDAASLTRNRTFKSLYVSPIKEILDGMNRGSEVFNATADRINEPQPFRGVFDTNSSQTLHLYVDLKTPGADTLPVVIKHLDALRAPHNYLTNWNGTDVTMGQVTVHLTGDTPFDQMVAINSTYRDYFFDAPLIELEGSIKFNRSNSLMASTPFGKNVGKIFWAGGGVGHDMLAIVRKHIRAAHERGIGVRYWGTPGWPIGVRNEVWKLLVSEGVDLLNVDDLRAAVSMDW